MVWTITSRVNEQNRITYTTIYSHDHLKFIYVNKFFVCLHGDKIYNSFVCGNTT